jgi:hypothetical protein
MLVCEEIAIGRGEDTHVDGARAILTDAPHLAFLPDGRIQEVTAAESGLATVTLKDGAEVGFRPTIQDSSQWNRIVVTIFRMPTTGSPTTTLARFPFGEQSVNNFLPNARYQRGPVRATSTRNPRVQSPVLAYEPGGRRFESCRARHPLQVHSGR